MNKTIAVIMSTYNEKIDWLEKSVNSILNQTYPDVHLYVVLDNPNASEIRRCMENYAEMDRRVSVLYNEVNLGFVKSLNKLVQAVTEDYIARLDADDLSEPDRLEKQMEFLTRYDLDFVMCGAKFVDEKENVTEGAALPMLLTEDVRRVAMYGNPSIHSSWLLKKEVYDKVGPYREMKYCEDFDFFLRALQKGIRIGRMSQQLVIYRLRDTSLSMFHAREQYEKAELLRKQFVAKRPIERLNCEKINGRLSDFSQQEKKEFAEAKQMIDQFCNELYEKDYVRCFKTAGKGFAKSNAFRRQFIRAVRASFKMKQIYNSLSYK